MNNIRNNDEIHTRKHIANNIEHQLKWDRKGNWNPLKYMPKADSKIVAKNDPPETPEDAQSPPKRGYGCVCVCVCVWRS